MTEDREVAMQIFQAWRVHSLTPEGNEELLRGIADYMRMDINIVRSALCCHRCCTVCKSVNGVFDCRLCGHQWSSSSPLSMGGSE